MEQTNYEKLRTRINELLSHRVRPEFGAEIKLKACVDGAVCRVVNYDDETVDWQRGGITGTRLWDEVEQLGRPLDYGDIMQALDQRGWFALRSDGIILTYEKDNNHPLGDDYGEEGYEETGVEFDLSVAPCDVENDSACAAVLELLSV